MTATLKPRDAELLSAYLDDALTAPQRSQLEQRLAADSILRDELADLHDLRQLLRAVPLRRSPRRLTLTPEMVPARRILGAFPILRFSSVLATAALAVMVVFVELMPGFPFAARMAAPLAMESAGELPVAVPMADGAPLSLSPIINWGNPAPMGMGGGGGGVDGIGGGPVEYVAPDAKYAPQDSGDTLPGDSKPIPLDEANPILGVNTEGVPDRKRSQPVLPASRWAEIGLAVIALGSGLAAWILHQKSK